MASLRKDELVTLESGTNGKQEFNPAHAEKILSSKNNNGPGEWKLPEKSPYKLEDGKLIRGSNTGAN